MEKEGFDSKPIQPPAELIGKLTAKARKLRKDVLVMLARAKSGHTGGSLSAVDILVAIYYHVMRHRPSQPDWPDRDRFVLSNVNAAPALYAVLADCGYLSLDYLDSLRRVGFPLRNTSYQHTPGVEISTGSLGHGLSFANGMALGNRIDSRDSRIYVLLDFDECQDGEIWEAAMSSAHYKLGHLTAIVDKHVQQICARKSEEMGIDPLDEKFRAFGWQVLDVEGHNFSHLLSAFRLANQERFQPTVIIAHTIENSDPRDFSIVVPITKRLEKQKVT